MINWGRFRRLVWIYGGLVILVGFGYLGEWFGEQRLLVWEISKAYLGVSPDQGLNLGLGYNLLLVGVAALLPSIYFSIFRLSRATWMVVLTAIMVVAVWLGVHMQYGFAVPVFDMLMGLAMGLVVAVLVKLVTSSHEQEFLRVAFSQFVSEQVLKELLKDPNKLALQGKESLITVMFMDIRGFTEYSEKHNAVLVVNRLNNLLDIATQIVFKHGGTVDKYMGDSVMAFWGAPTVDKKQAQNAVAAALEIREKILKETEFRVGIGINTGMAIVGNVGSSRRFDYTAIGDTVNTAARLEKLTKENGEMVLVTEPVLQKLVEERVNVKNARDMGEVVLRGKDSPTKVFAL